MDTHRFCSHFMVGLSPLGTISLHREAGTQRGEWTFVERGSPTAGPANLSRAHEGRAQGLALTWGGFDSGAI